MDKLKLMKTANEIRKGIVTSVHSAKAGHPGGSLSAAEIFTYLYLDLREFGVILGMIFFGYYCNNAYIRAVRSRNLRNMLLFSIMIYNFSQCMIRWPFFKGPNIMAIIYVGLCVKRIKSGNKSIVD